MKRSSPSPLPDTIKPARSHYLDFGVGRAAPSTAAGAGGAAPLPSIVGGRGQGGGGISALSLASSPYGNNTTTTTSSCFAGTNNNGCSFGSTDSCIGWGQQQGTRRTNTTTSTTTVNEDNDNDDNNKNVDPTVFISKAMNRLSIPERELGYEDIHGVSSTIEETPELIVKSLQQLEIEIEENIPMSQKSAYELAKSMSNGTGKEYVYDTKLRIMFLRATRFDIERSAKRFLKWFNWKLELFGIDKLCQPRITYNDLSEDAKVVVESGLVQLLPVRDSRGRSIVYFSYYYTNLLFRSKLATLQMIFYMLMNHIMDNEVTQRNGMVYIIYSLRNKGTTTTTTTPGSPTTPTTTAFVEDGNSPNNSDLTWKISDLCSGIPIRPVAMHSLTNSHGGSAMAYWLSWIAKSLETRFLSRLRIHYGSHIECEYALTSFGIPTYYLPVTSEGDLKLTNHKKWIQRQLIKEDELQRQYENGNTSYIFPGIELPNNNDVLLGQGKPFRDHPGNKRLIEILRCYLEEYNLAPRGPRGQIIVTRKVMNKIIYNSPSGGNSTTGGSSSGGGSRFLKLRIDPNKSGWWEEVIDEDVILERIRNGFRNIRNKPKYT